MASIVGSWIAAFRLRTLPLAVSGIIMGTFLADIYTGAESVVFWMALLTAILLQILSNLANDYGDFTKGTDNHERIGNTRSLQSGAIEPTGMLRAIRIFAFLSLICGILLLLQAFEGELKEGFFIFLLLGIGAIIAAIKYTMGRNAYGYSGWGDIFVFLFFGPVSVIGTFFLHARFEFDIPKEWPVFLPAIAIGLLCTGVLNTNNIRDIVNDKASGKRTIPVQIGLRNARIYHALLISAACTCFVCFLAISDFSSLTWASCLAFIPMFAQLRQVFSLEPSPAYNNLLKQLSLATLLLVLLLVAAEMAGNGWELAGLLKAGKQ